MADHCTLEASRALARALTPSDDREEVLRRQRLTAEGKRLRRIKPRFTINAPGDPTLLVQSAARGGRLTASELLDVLGFARAARHTRNHVIPLGDRIPTLTAIAKRIGDFTPLIDALDGAIGARGEILDSASPELSERRRAIQVAHARLHDRMERLLRQAVSRGLAQEPIMTERDGRYVVPIKADAKRYFPGIVHGVSSSGATLFIEPIGAVELGNAWREARAREEQEVEKILRRLSAAVGEEASPICQATAAMGEIDFALAKADLAADLDAPLPHEGLADDEAADWIGEAPGELRLEAARHPLLSGDIVPISLSAGADHRGVLITGPNTGGKTVALKTTGLLTLMALAGLPIPAELGSRIPVYTTVAADIGDEQSIEQSLSTFSSHMRNIIRILESADMRALVLLDELGAGTDPTEGAALGRALLTHLLTLGATFVATTHHGELKLFAHETPGVINASVEFDDETLSPTYRLSLGLPGRSNAIAIAERLGLPPAVLDDARAVYAPGEQSVERLLTELQRERNAAADARSAEEFARREAEEIRRHLRRRLDEVESERDRVLARTEAEMERELTAMRSGIRDAEKRLAAARKVEVQAAQAEAAAGRARLTSIRRERAAITEKRAAADPATRGAPVDPSAIRAGQIVRLRGVPQPGEALGTLDEDGTIAVQLGALRTRVRADQIIAIGGRDTRPGAVRISTGAVDPGSRIEVRGRTLDEAIPTVESFVDQAFRAGLERIEVVHGKGTGTLRRAVRDLLRRHPLVTKYAPAERNEGGEGVTIAHLAI